MAAELAGVRPGVRRLALLGPAGHGGARRQTLPMENWRQATSPAALEAAFYNNLASLMLFDEACIDELALEVQARSNLRTRFRSKPISRSASLTAALARVDAPTLLLWGEHDVTVDPRAVAPGLLAAHSGCQCLILSGVGHWIQYEAADECNQRLADWFAVS